MLVELLHHHRDHIRVSSLPPSVVPLKAAEFIHNDGHGRSVKIQQFPVTLAYAMTDYKCQGKTLEYVVVDLKKPPGRGVSAPTSAYVQLSRATSLDRVSIMRPFNVADLTTPLPQELIDELRWQEEMANNTLRML
jgi:hypothetical protein